MPATLDDYDALLTAAGIPNLDPKAATAEGGKGFTGTGADTGTRGFYEPQLPPGLEGQQFINEYARQLNQSSSDRYGEGTIGPATAPEEMGEFSKGVGAGIDQVQALVAGGGAALADVVGLEPARDYLLNIYAEQMAEAAQYTPTVGTIEEVFQGDNNFSKFIDWAAYATGEQVPTILSMVASAGIGGAIAKLMGQKAISAGTAKLLEAQAGKLSAEVAAKLAAQKVIGRGIAAGGFLGASAMETGGILGEQVDAGLDPQGGVALLGGMAAGALETAVPLGLARMFGLTTPMSTSLFAKLRDSAMASNMATRAATIGTAAAIGEASTESAQEAIAIAARKFVDDNYDALGAEARSRILNSAATGALLGFVTGGAGGAIAPRDTSARTPAQEAEADLLKPITPPPSAVDVVAPQGEGAPPSPPQGEPLKVPPQIEQEGESPVFGQNELEELIFLEQADRLRQENPEEYERKRQHFAQLRVNQRDSLSLPNRNQEAGLPAGNQPDPALVTPTQVTLLTTSVDTPVQRVDIRDFDIPQRAEEDPEILVAKESLRTFETQRDQILRNPESYTQRGKLRAEAQSAVLRLDDAIAAQAEIAHTEVKLTPESMVTQPSKSENLEKLSPGQRRDYHRLMTKIDDGEVLSDRETTRLDNYEGIITGDPLVRETLPENKKTELLKAMEEAAQKEAERGARELVQKRRIQKQIDALDLEDTDVNYDEEPLNFSTDEDRAGSTPEGGKKRLSVGQAREATESVRLIDEGMVVLVPSTSAIRDPRVLAAIKKYDSEGVTTQAVHIRNDDGTAYTVFLLDRIDTPERLASLYTHEILVHYGLRTLPKEQRRAIISLLKKHRRDEMELYARQRNTTLNAKNEDVIAEEVLAEFSENNDFELGLVRRIFAAIRQWVRKLYPGLNLSDNDIRFILQGLQRRLQKAPPRRAPIPTLYDLQSTLDFPPSAAQKLTTRVLQKLYQPEMTKQLHQGTLTQGQYRKMIRRYAASKEERDLLLSVLDSYTDNRISPAEFEQAVYEQLVVFDNYPDTQAQWADYAADGSNLALLYEEYYHAAADRSQGVVSEPVNIEPRFTIFNDLRKDGPFKSGHYHREPYYRGHVRGFGRYYRGNPDEYVAVEVQSDYAQQLNSIAAMTPEQRTQSKAMLSVLKTYSKLIDDAEVSQQSKILEDVKRTSEEIYKTQFDPKEFRQFFIEFGGELQIDPMLSAELESRVAAIQVLENNTAQAAFQQVAPSIFKRMLREDMKRAAKEGFAEYSFLHPNEVAAAERWDLNTNEGHKRLYNRYKKLYAWFKQEFGGTEQFEVGLLRNSPPLRRQTVSLEGVANEPVVTFAATIPGREAARLQAEADMVRAVDMLNKPWMMRFRGVFHTMLQLAKTLNVLPLNRYTDRLTEWAADKGGYIAEADLLMKDTRKKLSKTEQATLARLMFSLSAAGGEQSGSISVQDKTSIYRQAGLTWTDVETDKHPIQVMQERYERYLDNINREMQDAAMKQIMYRIIKRGKMFRNEQAEVLAEHYVTQYNETDAFTPLREDLVDELMTYAAPSGNLDDIAFAEDALVKLAALKDQYEAMRGKNYFPYKRFGKWGVIVRARKNNVEWNGKTYQEGETAALWTFENTKDQASWLDTDELVELHQSGDFNVEGFKLTEVEESHIDIPPGFLESLKKLLKGTPEGLSDAQELALERYELQFTPGSKFVAHMMKRRGIEGMSLDMQRTFATYAQSAANHIARVNHAARLLELQDEAITQLTDAVSAQAGSSPINLNGVSILKDDLKRHFHYIMEPGNELAWLRSLGFTWYLGFNVKSALVNLTQVPMVSYPYLAGKYGAGKAFAALNKAIPDSTAFARKNAKPVEPWLDKLIARGVRELFLDESLGVELAGAAQGDIMSRVLPSNPVTRGIHRVGQLASLPFQFTEKISRRLVFIAAARLYMQSEGVTGTPTMEQSEAAYRAGRDAVRETIFEYQKWNRPRFMRGKLSPIFLFWTFMQHMLYTLGGGYGKGQAARVFGMLFVAAGTMGLPLAENITDMLDYVLTKLQQKFGVKNPHTDLRLELRKLLQDAPGGPDLWMYGLSSRAGLGPLHILDLLGAPIPQVDVSGSIGLGRPVPGLQELTGRANSTAERFGRVGLDVLGPVAAIFYNTAEMMGSTDPDTWKRVERALPVALKSISKATRIASRGGEEFRRGGSVIDYDPGDMEHNLEQVAQFFGFTPTRLNDRYKLRAHQEDMRAFYMTWRQVLLEGYNYAQQQRDREGIKDAKDAIREFNKAVPDSRLRLNSKSLRRSKSASEERAALREEGKAYEKGLRKPFREIKDLYPGVVP